MVKNTISATYTETYDLNTVNDELSILAIHTPQSSTLKRMFHGFYEQYSKMKVVSCDFRMVCASTQKLDPTQVGFGATQMNPRDVLNPILFKACTGEGMNVLLDTIYNQVESNASGSSVDQHLMSNAAHLNAYYSLLADDSFRKEHPQSGITVLDLRPKVHRVVTTQPFKWSVADNVPFVQSSATPSTVTTSQRGFGAQSGSSNSGTDPLNENVFVSNGLAEMPWLDTAYSTVATFTSKTEEGSIDEKVYVLQNNIPRVYCGVLILPPSEGINLYFRLQLRWNILFRDFRPSQDMYPLNRGAYELGPDDSTPSLSYHDDTYFNLYHTSSKLDRDVGSIDTTGVENILVINEKVN